MEACREGFARLQRAGLKPLKQLKGPARLPRGSFHQALWPSAFAVPGLQPAQAFLHIPRGSFHQARGRQRSSLCKTAGLQPSNCCTASSRQLPPSPLAVRVLNRLCCSRVAACPLPAQLPRGMCRKSSWPSAFQHCSKALCLHIALSWKLPRFKSWRVCQGFKRLKPLKALKAWQTPSRQLPRMPSGKSGLFAVPGLQPALCLHIPRRHTKLLAVSVREACAACPLPAHSPLLLRHSSLPFARLQTA